MEYAIGIDAGTHTGIAIYNVKKSKFSVIKSLPLHLAHIMILDFNNTHKGNFYVIVEDARQRKWFGKESDSKLQGAGSIKRDCRFWDEVLNYHKMPHLFVHPINGGTKLKSDYFKKITGYTERTNEHGRDAAMLVFGRKSINKIVLKYGIK